MTPRTLNRTTLAAAAALSLLAAAGCAIALGSILGLDGMGLGEAVGANLWADLALLLLPALGVAGTLAAARMGAPRGATLAAGAVAGAALAWAGLALGFAFAWGNLEFTTIRGPADPTGFFGMAFDAFGPAWLYVLENGWVALPLGAVFTAAAGLMATRPSPSGEAPAPASSGASASASAPAGARPAAAAARATAAGVAGGVAPKRTNGHALSHVDPHKWVVAEGLATTADLALPELLIDEVIGQEEAVEVAKKAARQRRHLLLLGDPGTGKSMIAKAMAQILPPVEQSDVLVLPNPKDRNQPAVQVLPGGKGREFATLMQHKARTKGRVYLGIEILITAALLGAGFYAFATMGGINSILVLVICAIAAILFLGMSRQFGQKAGKLVPNLLIERTPGANPAPYVDGTGAHAGALLGDIRHDPFQSGGLETPTHLRVEPGAIHRAHKGLLFIDEINVLRLDSQQALLTAMQDRRYAITGQSERSSGAMAKTDPVPCDFILVAAGNMDVIAPTDSRYTGLHPALRSRIRGYGYEVYVKSVMDDSDDNRRKLVRFVAQEVRRDGQIPHFSGAAVAEVIREAQRRSGHTGKLTLRLRELGGLVRTAGDIARDGGEAEVTVDHVLAAKRMSMSLEHQVTLRGIEVATAREAMTVGAPKVGAAIGCAFMGTGETGEPAGIVVPIEADATPSSDRSKGTLYLGGGLEKDPAVADTLSSVLKRVKGTEMAGIDLHAQALLQQVGADVGALGAAAAVASLSALEGLAVRQDTVVIGALSVNGRLRAVDGVTQMVEGAADLGYARAIVPAANKDDILLEHRYRDAIEVVLAEDIGEAASAAMAAPAARLAPLREALRRKAEATVGAPAAKKVGKKAP